MVELRFTAEKLNGQTLIGSLTAVSSLEGRKKITRLAEKNQHFCIESEKGRTSHSGGNRKLLPKRKLKMPFHVLVMKF